MDDAAATRPTGWWLPGLLALAAVLRIVAAFAPGFHHPDAIYQYLEPAHRLLTGEGVITWEWRAGIRSWLIPTLLAVPLGIGEALDPNGLLPMLLPRLATGAASLASVWAAWAIGRRHGRTTAALAAFVVATWCECIFFAATTLSEPLATAAILPAAALVTAPSQTPRRNLAAGALLGFAALARPHYAPACAALVAVAWWTTLRPSAIDLRRWGWLFAGAAAVAALSAAIDLSHGLTPFAWIPRNYQQNIVHNVSARFGVLPPLSYVAWLIALWQLWIVPVAIGLRFGWRQCPPLLAAAVVTLVVHSLIPHKEYRFVFLAVATLLLLSALGWGELIVRARRRWGARAGRGIAVAVFAAWGIASVLVSRSDIAPNQLESQTAAGVRLAADLRADPAACGVALIAPAWIAAVPGETGLRRGVPLSQYWRGDPAMRGVHARVVATRWQASYNRVITTRPLRAPAAFHVRRCEAMGSERLCLMARAGGCTAPAASPFTINRMLARTGF